MLVVQVLWRSSQVKLLQHLFTSDLFNVVLGAQMWEKLRHKSIRTLKEKEKPRETLKKRFPLTDGCESESLSPCTFKLSSAIWANRAATEVRWRNAGDFGQNRVIWWEWGADMRKLKMKKKNLVRNIHSERNWCEKGLQVSSGNGFYSAQNNKERPSHWKTQRAWRRHRLSERPGSTHGAAAVEPSQNTRSDVIANQRLHSSVSLSPVCPLNIAAQRRIKGRSHRALLFSVFSVYFALFVMSSPTP